MNWFKKHADTIAIIVVIAGAVNWMNNKIRGLEKDIARMDKDLAIIKAVLILQKTMPPELAKVEEIEKKK
jgi:hypothetical protein